MYQLVRPHEDHLGMAYKGQELEHEEGIGKIEVTRTREKRKVDNEEKSNPDGTEIQ